MMEFLIRMDTALFLFLNRLHHPSLDPVMVIISAKLTWIPLYALILVMLIWHFRATSWKYILAALVLLAITDLASVHLFKNIFLRLRPCHEPALAEMIHLVNGRCGGLYGFVSSHAANTFGFATLMALAFRRKYTWLGWLLMIWAAVVGYSRIYLGVHYPGDVLCGAAFGVLCGWIVWLILKKFLRSIA